MTQQTTSQTPVSARYESHWIILRLLLVIADMLVVLLSLSTAYNLRIASGWLTYNAPYSPDVYQALTVISLPIWIGLFALVGLYRKDTLLGGVIEYQKVVKACTAGVMSLVLLSVLWRDMFIVSRGWLILVWGVSNSFVLFERFAIRRIAYEVRKRGYLTARVLIVGANDQGIAIARQWSQAPTSGMQVVGFVDDFKPLGTSVVHGLKVIGRPTSLQKIARETGANEVVVVPNAVAWETFEEIIANASNPNSYTLRLSPGFYELLTTGVDVTDKGFVPLLSINEARIVGTDAVLKTVLDYGAVVPLLTLATPLMGLIALVLKLARPDQPVFARYRTIGQAGAAFVMLKFNTRIEAIVRAGGQGRTAAAKLLAITWIERLLYRTGMDKLPQLLNVLAGHLSLVGPRPHVVNESSNTNAARNLLTVKPGFIGPWTSTGPCAAADETQDELYYVRNWTIWMDLQMIFQTLTYGLVACWRARCSVLRQGTSGSAAKTGTAESGAMPCNPHTQSVDIGRGRRHALASTYAGPAQAHVAHQWKTSVGAYRCPAAPAWNSRHCHQPSLLSRSHREALGRWVGAGRAHRLFARRQDIGDGRRGPQVERVC